MLTSPQYALIHQLYCKLSIDHHYRRSLDMSPFQLSTPALTPIVISATSSSFRPDMPGELL
ncbi:hypothetical protein HYPSUDRAFT_39864 [Hypholoma sublateritium FD-334 SS-4]|uniref:Uncharacterized protein n=1 Tax=Hypholoma sublateritium (strain FD-334 SS-4) TaxID=945553 RepID=A0A0D2MIA0_HYPSF|nr:hypothetical protein HYPSUDRAFT_39864 [Hypholoma sublateritium FD-334 SS-4]